MEFVRCLCSGLERKTPPLHGFLTLGSSRIGTLLAELGFTCHQRSEELLSQMGWGISSEGDRSSWTWKGDHAAVLTWGQG